MANKLRASVLSFRHLVDPSDAILFSSQWDSRSSWKPLPVREKTVRGTISNRMDVDAADPIKLNADICNPNPQTVDYACLPSPDDTLGVQFTLRIHGGWGVPDSCNNDEVQARLQEMVKGYCQGTGPLKLGTRYAQNIANARWLWRNMVGAEAIEVQVRKMANGAPVRIWQFDAHNVSLDDFTNPSAEVQSLGADIAHAFVQGGFCMYQVLAFARLGPGVEVYPSQLLLMEKTTKSRTFYQCVGQGAITSQKIGNALRTLDTWHASADTVGPIAIEPYGAVTSRGAAYRKGLSDNFYTLFDKWLDGKEITPTEQHFVMAVLIRGGVLGTPDEEKAAKKKAEAEAKKKAKAAAKAAAKTGAEPDDEEGTDEP